MQCTFRLCIYIFCITLTTNFVSSEFDKLEGEKCVLKDNGEGLCKSLSSCPTMLTTIDSEDPVICSFDDEAIVCCPESAKNSTALTIGQKIVPAKVNMNEPSEAVKKTKSYQKCVEYAEHAYVWQKSPLPNEPPIKVSQCGFEIKTLIVGGEPAQLKEFPHMVVLGYGDKDNPSWECGGSLISEQYVLTAGHCWSSRKSRTPPVVIRTGLVNLVNGNEAGSTQEFTVAKMVKHPNRTHTRYNDIGLIKLNKPVTFTAFVRPACLHVGKDIDAKAAYATGWGKDHSDSEAGTDDLMKVKLSLVSYGQCYDTFKRSINRLLKNGIDDESMICAGEIHENKDTCQGDSGGPLQIFRKDVFCMYDLIGVTSFGGICGLTSGVYTRISHYISWIESVVWS